MVWQNLADAASGGAAATPRVCTASSRRWGLSGHADLGAEIIAYEAVIAASARESPQDRAYIDVTETSEPRVSSMKLQCTQPQNI
jgi:hypothetical protein